MYQIQLQFQIQYQIQLQFQIQYQIVLFETGLSTLDQDQTANQGRFDWSRISAALWTQIMYNVTLFLLTGTWYDEPLELLLIGIFYSSQAGISVGMYDNILAQINIFPSVSP